MRDDERETPLRILVIASARIPVPPHGYGGAERVLAQLCEGLAHRGHHVTLMAAKGSKDYGRLITYPWGGRGPFAWRAYSKLNFMARSARELMRGHDVVLAGCRVDYLAPFLLNGIPIAYRFGNPILEDEVRFLQTRARGPLTLISVSDHQRLNFSGNWQTIHNGTDLERFPASSHSAGEYLAFLGRLTANKGAHIAIRVAQNAGIPIRMAANISDEPGGRAFFEAHIRPQLSERVQWIGEIGDKDKATFLGGASALLAPIQWDEPCANIVSESLACGTPVITTRRGSMPELIVNSRNGFLVDDEDQMVSAVRRIPELSRRACREDAELRMSSSTMVERYLRVLQAMVNSPCAEQGSLSATDSP